jgi:SAM-dependent methyltransferase
MRFAIPLTLSLFFALPGSSFGQLPPMGDPPYIPTPMPLVERMLDMARVGPGDVVYDLGSGDGRLVIAAARRGARGIGIEYEGWLVDRSWAAADSAGVRPRVDFIHGDIFDHEVRDASVVMLYMGAEFNLRMRPRLLEQLRPGARVVSHAFHMGDWAPDAEETLGGGAERATLFSWIIPATVDGFWSLEVEGFGPASLEFRQRYQILAGEVRQEGRSVPLTEGSLRGTEVRFTMVEGTGRRATTLDFTGTVVDGRLSGEVRGPGEWGTRRWRALRFSDPLLSP